MIFLYSCAMNVEWMWQDSGVISVDRLISNARHVTPPHINTSHSMIAKSG